MINMAHPSYPDLEKRKAEALKRVKVGGIYFHHKNPQVLYKVIDIAFQEADESLCVIYQMVDNPTLTWVRNLEGEKGFLTPEVTDGKKIIRFQEKD